MHDRRFLLFKKDVGQLLESPKFPPEGWEQEFCFTLQGFPCPLHTPLRVLSSGYVGYVGSAAFGPASIHAAQSSTENPPKIKFWELGIVVYAFNSSTQEAEAGRLNPVCSP
ncbi:hypothetical protein LEMLEM_LOCUS22113 [Lemmus lemmus]